MEYEEDLQWKSLTDDAGATLVAVGIPLGVNYDGAEYNPNDPESYPNPWFRQGKRYLKIEWPSYVLLSALSVPMGYSEICDFCDSAALGDGDELVKGLLGNGLVVVLPSGDSSPQWRQVMRLKAVSHAIGLGWAPKNNGLYMIIPATSRAIAPPTVSGDPPEFPKTESILLERPEYLLWTAFDGIRSIDECVEAVSERTGVDEDEIRSRVPQLLRRLLKEVFAALDVA